MDVVSKELDKDCFEYVTLLVELYDEPRELNGFGLSNADGEERTLDWNNLEYLSKFPSLKSFVLFNTLLLRELDVEGSRDDFFWEEYPSNKGFFIDIAYSFS